MAKRNESAIDLLILAPWWVSAILAGVAYLVLGVVLPSLAPSGVAMQMFSGLGRTVAPWVACGLLFLAAISALRSWRVKAQLGNQCSRDSLAALPWKDFEDVTGELFRRQGYSVEESLGGGADGGVDLRLRRNGELTLVQCKRWKSKKIGEPIVRELLGAIAAERADHGILVTTSTCTKDAHRFARAHGISLIQGEELLRSIRQVQAGKGSSSVENAGPTTLAETSAMTCCAKCGAEMVKRTAARGPNAGSQFWGCTAFPKCRHTQAIQTTLSTTEEP
jgi:restriction system protein